MPNASADILSFFGGDEAPTALALAFEARLFAELPETDARIQKSQITYSNKHVFACLSRPKRKKDGASIVVSFGLNRRESSARIWVAVEPYTGRWTHHVIVSSAEQIDDELMGWLREACAFSASK